VQEWVGGCYVDICTHKVQKWHLLDYPFKLLSNVSGGGGGGGRGERVCMAVCMCVCICVFV